MRTRISLVALICLAFSSPVVSQQSILWEISGNGITTPSYLMGTLKFIGENEFFIPKECVDRLAAIKIFAIEDQIDHHAQHELNAALHFPAGESLKSHLSESDYRKVTDFFHKEFGITERQFEHHYSKLVPLALSISMTRLSLGEKVKFYDIELLKLAKANRLETYSLEEIEREARALLAFPMDAQIHALLRSIENFQNQKDEFSKLVEEFAHGDLDKIFQYTVHPTEDNPTFIEEFYYKRNREWIPKLDKMFHDKPAFVAVGIAHLEGENGLLSLLRAKGYTLKPVPITR